MDITPIIPSHKKILTSYGNGGFAVNKERVEGSIIIYEDGYCIWQPPYYKTLNDRLHKLIVDIKNIELILIGTGPKHIINTEIDLDIKFEIMNTGAACRTYNILLAEGRKIAAALIAV